ncbi:MAG: STAS domain-containing protein [Spirochaetia bacterium]|nr:STAS domain-containing protein [Spirochaetia bacterium]MDD7269157.1 STAS domain-containing protein [Treponema sp.]MDY4986231.1 STAS domain-containing protein [Treponema sp.]
MDNNNAIIPGFDNEKDDSLTIVLRKADGIPRGIFIYLSGYIDTYNSSFFQKQITKVIEAGYINLVFNCSSLNYVSSTGIGSFTVFLKIVKPKGGDVVLLEIQPKVYEVFQLLGFSQFFNIKNTADEAIAFFSAGGVSSEASVFPLIISCPVCVKKLRATKSGRFRCSGCRSILAINDSGEVSLG